MELDSGWGLGFGVEAGQGIIVLCSGLRINWFVYIVCLCVLVCMHFWLLCHMTNGLISLFQLYFLFVACSQVLP